MKIVGYIRVSTEDQAEVGVSLDAQRKKLEQYAELYDLELVAIIEDAGASAKTLNRPGLQQALAALDGGEAEGLLIAKLDRLTRDVRDMGDLLEGYFASKFNLLCVAEQIDTRTASGRLMLNLLTSVAQWERETIGERTSAALRHKQSQGEHVGSPALGYDMKDGELVENAEEAAVVERIQELRAEGLTYQQIADTLTAEGLRTKRGGGWYPATVRNYVKRMAG